MMKLVLCLFVAFVAAPAALAFVPPTSFRCATTIAASRIHRSTSTPLSAKKQKGEKAQLGDIHEPEGQDNDGQQSGSYSAPPTFEEFLKFKQAERANEDQK